MINTSQFKNGMTLDIGGDLMTIIEFQHVKPGKGGAFVRTKLKNAKTGRVLDQTFRAGEKVEQARLDRRTMQYLYSDGSNYTFMDTSSYEQDELSGEFIGDNSLYLKENMEVSVVFHSGNPIGIDLPLSVELVIKETTAGIKGDTVQGGTKPATLETGATVNVPMFIDVGETIKVDTRTGDYLERA